MWKTKTTAEGRVRLVGIAGVALAYIVTGAIGLHLDPIAKFAAFFWPPCGIALALLTIGNLNWWPGVVVGGLALPLLAGATLPVSLGLGLSCSLEIMVAFAFFRQFSQLGPRRRPGQMRSLRNIMALAFIAAPLSCGLGATLGAHVLRAGGYIGPMISYRHVWTAWTTGHFLSYLVFVPLILTWAGSRRVRLKRRDLLEVAGLGTLMASLGVWIFYGRLPTHEGCPLPAFLAFPIIIWSALRLGSKGSATASFLLSGLAICATLMGFGPFAAPLLSDNLFALQAFIGVLSLAGLMIATAIQERDEREELRARNELHLEFIAGSSALLSGSLEYHATLERAVELAVPALADVCIVHLIEKSEIKTAAICGKNLGQKEHVLLEIKHVPLHSSAEHGPAYVIKTGRPELHPGPPASEATHRSGSDMLSCTLGLSYPEFLRVLGTCSYISVPIHQASGRVIGAITFVLNVLESGKRRYGSSDLLFIEEFSRSVGLAIERARLYQEARSTSSLLSTLMMNSPVGMAVLDESGRYARVNAALASITGHRISELIGRRSSDVLSPYMAAKVEALHKQVRQTGHAATGVELTNEPSTLSQASRRRSWMVSYYPILASDRSWLGTGVVVQETTAQKLIEERTRAVEKLQEAVRAREEVLSIVSHDLKNPLLAIQLGTDLLCRNFGAKQGSLDQTMVHRQLQLIYQAAKYMEALIHDLLEVAKVEARGISIHGRDENAATLVCEVIEMLRPLAQDKAIRVTSEVPPLGFEVFCDRERTHQILANIIGNAIKFSPPGERVVVSALKHSAEIEFTVADHGPGISPEAMRHLFERFWQAKESSRKGTGLGLSIAKRIVEAQGGRIWVESSTNRGSIFHFTLPIKSFFPLHHAA